MSLFVIIGAQATGKMTVGRELEKKIAGKLLYNHQTIDIFANYLGYTKETFRLSEELRKSLFKAFVENAKTNATESIIFTVVVNFDEAGDHQFLQDISQVFLEGQQKVYFIELVASLEERLERNIHEKRLAAKPSKRDVAFSRNELLTSMEKHRLQSNKGEVEKLYPFVQYLKVDNTHLAEERVAEIIVEHFQLT